jgi:hypothetical protein
MAKAIRDSKRVAKRPRAQSKVSTAKLKYEDPATFPDVYAARLDDGHLAPAYPNGCFLIVDKRLCPRAGVEVTFSADARFGSPPGLADQPYKGRANVSGS